jgi:hypothetical protein
MTKSFKKCLLQNLPTKTTTLVSVRRTAELAVPGTIAAVTDSRGLLAPSPQLNQRMNPHVQMKYPDICKVISNLLLACTLNLFEIMKVLLNGRPIGNRLQNLLGGSRKVCAHVSSPAIYRLPNYQDQNLPACWTIRCLKHLNLFGFLPSVKRYLYRKPAPLFSGLVGKVYPWAVFTWLATFSLCNRLWQGIQGSILSQSGNNRYPQADGRLNKSGFGETSISNNPELFSQAFAALLSPSDQFRRLLKFILESYSVRRRHISYILCPDIHLGQNRQANGPPELMADYSRDSYPQMTVDELSPIRGSGGITMNSGPLHFRPISLCRAVIDGHQDSIAFAINQIYHNLKQDSRYYFSFPAQRADEIVERFISLGDTSGPKPTGSGLSTLGEDYSGNYGSQAPGRALMQNAAKSSDPCLPGIWENPFIKHWLSFANVCFVSTKHIGKDEPFLLQYRFIKELN